MARTLPNPIVTTFTDNGKLVLEPTAVQANFDDISANSDLPLMAPVYVKAQVSPDTAGGAISPGTLGAGALILVSDAAAGAKARISDGTSWINLG